MSANALMHLVQRFRVIAYTTRFRDTTGKIVHKVHSFLRVSMARARAAALTGIAALSALSAFCLQRVLPGLHLMRVGNARFISRAWFLGIGN